MNEERVFFQGDARLEGMLGSPTAGEEDKGQASGAETVTGVKGGVVVAHPYPPNGADMDLPVVYRIAKECRSRGLASLRFNFRSVGASEGGFSGNEEYRDVLAAVSYLRATLDSKGKNRLGESPLGLAGWSFGSVMAARAAAQIPNLRALALVGFVPSWENLPEDTLGRLARFGGPVLAVCAENDHIDSPDEVERVLADLGLVFRLEVIREADHYLMGRDTEVGEMVGEFFAENLGR